MKHFSVEIGPTAISDIQDAFWHIHKDSPQNARVWLEKLYLTIDSLETMPERCGIVRENDAFEEEVRHLLHFSHRVIFTVDHGKSLVMVHRLRHAAQDELPADEL